MQLDEVREQYKVIARSANSRAQQRKLEFLEHNLDALNSVQKQLVEQNTALKKEVGVAERKLLGRNERIQNLESLLNDADTRLAQKNQRYEQQIQALRERFAEVQAQQHPAYNHARIAKPLRGGGGVAQPATSVFSNNPLTRAQEESAASAKRRESIRPFLTDIRIVVLLVPRYDPLDASSARLIPARSFSPNFPHCQSCGPAATCARGGAHAPPAQPPAAAVARYQRTQLVHR